MSTIEEVFAALAANPGCHSDLHLRFLPVAMEALQSTENQLPLGLVAVSQCYRIHIIIVLHVCGKFNCCIAKIAKLPYPDIIVQKPVIYCFNLIASLAPKLIKQYIIECSYFIQAVLDVLVPIVRGCRGEGHEELRASIVTQVFPTVVQRLLSSDDSAILQVYTMYNYKS